MPLRIDAEDENLLYGSAEKTVETTAAVMSDNLEIFSIIGGPIEMKTIIAVCMTPNDGTASTLRIFADPTVGASSTICGISASLANAIAGTIINLVGNALITVPVISPAGTAISQLFPILIPTGILGLTIAGGSTTGTWKWHVRYMPLTRGAKIIASF